jgi:hypothetical protein
MTKDMGTTQAMFLATAYTNFPLLIRSLQDVKQLAKEFIQRE